MLMSTKITMMGALLQLLLITVQPVCAAVTLDGSMGRSGAVTGPNYAITPDLGKQVGINLFHSFSNFNLIKGDVATFSGTPNVTTSNIINRVTGGSASSIDGALKSTIYGANMYFLNPAGVMFGPNATLNISGSFHVSTAEYLKLGTDGRFDVRTPANSVLTTSPPSAFGFVTAKRASILFNGTNFDSVKSFTVVGGDITFNTATLSVADTNLNLISAASSGEANITNGSMESSTIKQFGDINLKNGSLLKLSAGTVLSPLGNIKIETDKLNITDSSRIETNASNQIKGGNISINANDSVNLLSGGIINAGTTGYLNGGAVLINTKNLNISGYGSRIRTTAQLYGDGGDINIKATDSVTVSNGAVIETGTSNDGNSGNIIIETGKLTSAGRDVLNSRIDSSTSGSGRGGAIIIKASDSINISDGSIISAGTSGNPIAPNSGDAGSITFNANTLNLSNGTISLTSYYSNGNGGLISIKAFDSVNLAAESYIMSKTSYGNGVGGSIIIDTKNLNLSDGSLLWGGTYSGGKSGDITIRATDSINMLTNSSDYFTGILAETSSKANAGNIVLQTNKLNLSESVVISTEANVDSEGNGGNIEISATESIKLDNRSRITASTNSKGNAGNIIIETGKLNLSGIESGISSSTFSVGNGGSISIKAYDTVSIADGGAVVSVAQAKSKGNAGNITVETCNLKVSGNDTGISSSTYAAGNGGSVSIKAADSVSIADGGSLASESTNTGRAGEITIIVNNNLSLKDGSITTATVNAGGGSITIDPVLVHLKNSSITTSVKGGTGNGGNINLTAKQLVLDNSRIVAQADAGNGGNINLNADVIIQSPTGSLISASSNLGVQGSVVLSSPVLDVNAALVEMPSSLRDIASLSPRRCITTGDEISSFVVYSCGVSLRQADAAIIGK